MKKYNFECGGGPEGTFGRVLDPATFLIEFFIQSPRMLGADAQLGLVMSVGMAPDHRYHLKGEASIRKKLLALKNSASILEIAGHWRHEAAWFRAEWPAHDFSPDNLETWPSLMRQREEVWKGVVKGLAEVQALACEHFAELAESLAKTHASPEPQPKDIPEGV